VEHLRADKSAHPRVILTLSRKTSILQVNSIAQDHRLKLVAEKLRRMLFGRKSERLLRPAEPGIGGWTAISTIDTGIPTLKNRCAPGIPGRSSAAIHFNGRAIFLKKRVARAIGKIGNDAPDGI
jgi:hypothetical protein